MNNQDPQIKFVSSRICSLRLGIPATWLVQEAKAKRIPCIKPGRRMLFNVKAVEAALLSRKLEAVSSESSNIASQSRQQ